MKFIIFVIFATLMCSVSSTNVTPCKTSSGKLIPISETVIENCENPPCVLKAGPITWINITFTAEQAHTKLSNDIMATFMGRKHGYPGYHKKNACPYITSSSSDSSSACPLEPGKTYTYSIPIEVKSHVPKITVPMRFGVKDDNLNEDIACFEVMVKIQ